MPLDQLPRGQRWARLDEMKVGDRRSTVVRIDADVIRGMAELTGDENALHVDPAAARRIGQSRPLAHGMVLLGAVSRVIGTELPGHGSVWFKNEIEFLSPCYEGDEVTLTLAVTHVSLVTRVVVLGVSGQTAAGVEVIGGRVQVRLPEIVAHERSTDMEDQERVTIVTGGSRGIGRAIVEALAGPHSRVVVTYRQDEASAKTAVAAVEQRAGQAVAVAADLAHPAGARQVIDAAQAAYGRVDAIVHCATPPIVRTPFLDTTAEDFRALFDTYVIGLSELARLAAPGMKDRRRGRIVALLSSAVAEVPPKLSAYTTAKHALLGLCRSLAVELGPWNVTVNAVTPSLVVGRHADDLGAAAREGVARKTPLRRLADADDVARSVRFLLSDDASFVSGVNLPVTGGLVF
ncbi:MAG: SDR family oxidoreductase [Acidobacteriota bacterium]